MKALKILGLAAVLLLLGGAVAFAADQIDGDDVETTDPARVCNETCVRTNEGDGEQVRTHTRTRTAWEEGAECVCDGEQPKVRTQERSSWTEEDEATRTLTQTRYEGEPAGECADGCAAGPSGPGDGSGN